MDFQFRREVVKAVGSGGLYLCFQCGACVGNCPAARMSKEFNPRKIIFHALMGYRDELLGPNSIIWKCTTCFNCHERCPQDACPVSVIGALKTMCVRENLAPPGFTAAVEAIKKTGRAVPAGGAIEKRRAALGLPPLPRIAIEEMQKLMR